MTSFLDKDWLESKKEFDIIKLQFPESEMADDAYFYLAEVDFQKGEYIVATYGYNSLRRAFPNSPHAEKAAFQSAVCYYKLSPPLEREQTYTTQAIQALMEFQTYYPKDSLTEKAGTFISELRNKLAEGELIKVDYYFTSFSYRAALIYINKVLDEYPDTPSFELALGLKSIALSRQQKLADAEEAQRSYVKNFPDGSMVKEIETALNEARTLTVNR